MSISLLLQLTRRDFSDRYTGSVLGAAWAVIWPLVNILIYVVIFGNLMGGKLDRGGLGNATSNYVAYLIAGLLPWTAFAATFLKTSTVFADKKAIISKMRLDLPALPLYIVLSESLTFAISMAIFLLYLLLQGSQLNASILFLPLVFIVQQIFAYALGFLVATLNVFLKDLKEAAAVVVNLWFWFTPIIYVETILPDWVKPLVAWNPACLFIKSYQNVLAFGTTPDFKDLIILTLLAHGVLLGAYLLFKRIESDVRDFI